MTKHAMLIVVSLMFFVSLPGLSFGEEVIIVDMSPPEPEYVELARIDTGFSADIQVTCPLPIKALVLINLSEDEAYIERLQIHADSDQWLAGESFWRFKIKPGARLDIPLIGPRKIKEIHFEGNANIVIKGIVDDGSMVLLEKIRLRSDEKIFTIEGHQIRVHTLLIKAEGKQEIRIEFLRINGEDVPVQQNKMETGQVQIILEAEDLVLSTIQLKAKARKGTSYISLWAEKEIPQVSAFPIDVKEPTATQAPPPGGLGGISD